MEQERARASALGYPDPINPDYEATTQMYHKTLTECLRRIKVGTTLKFVFVWVIKILLFLQVLKDQGEVANRIGIMVASHNEDTVRFALQKMDEIGI